MRAMADIDQSSNGHPGSVVGRLAFWIGLSALMCAAAGVLAANRDMMSPYLGFRLFSLGLPLGMLGMFVGVFAMIRSRDGRNPRARRRALTGLTLSTVTLSAVVGLALPSAGFPLINDITTDTVDPPVFVRATTFPANQGRDMAYPPSFADQQRAAYPSLGTKKVDMPQVVTMERIRTALEAMVNTEITEIDVDGGRIEAIAVSRWFRFVDDIVVRVTENDSGSKVDIRSKSRDGKGDLGANARRIELLSVGLN
jgi:uncharacterized protein (DUF1499 family)